MLESLRASLVGATARGVSLGTAAAVFEQLRAFGGYAFPKSHAAGIIWTVPVSTPCVTNTDSSILG